MKKIGAGVILIYRGEIGLLLRDNKPKILNPNTWALPGGGQEPNENLRKTASREFGEELRIYPRLTVLGVTDRGNLICFCTPSREVVRKIRKGREGQAFCFFPPKRLDDLKLGGELRIMFENHRGALEDMIETGVAPNREKLGLMEWRGQ